MAGVEVNASVSDGLWISVSELARQRGVDKAAISRRIQRLGLETRSGERNSKLVNLAEFDRAVGQTTDLVRATNGARAATPRDTAPNGDRDHVLAREQARRAAYDADLKKLDLDERLGKILPIADVEAAMVRCAESMVRAIEQLPSRADDLAAAVARDGSPGARMELKNIARELRETMSRELRLIEAESRTEDRPASAAPEPSPDDA